MLVLSRKPGEAITINENADPDVGRDMVMGINKLIPMHDDYLHLEGNSAAHIKSSLFGASETLIINNGKVMLGTWQGIYLCEHRNAGGPRRLVLTLHGELGSLARE